MKETKQAKVERIAHVVALSWLDTSERLLKRGDPKWVPGKLSEISEQSMMSMTAEYSALLPWATIRLHAVAMVKERLFLFPEKFPLTIAHFKKTVKQQLTN